MRQFTTIAFIFLALCMASMATRTATKAKPTEFRIDYSSSSSSLSPSSSSSETNYTYVCDASRFAKLGLNMSAFSFCNASLPYEERAKDLVKRLTLREKVHQLGNFAYGVPRLGLPKYEWWSEALHGISNVGPGTFFDDVVPGATSFPTVILTAASFDESLWRSIGEAVSTEARAMYNLGRAGLTYWSPNINVVRDPRWGRALETPGEDPFVVGKYAVNYVRGLQDVEGAEVVADPNQRPLKVSSCCKHYVAYDVDNWQGVDRVNFDARVREQDMVETFLRPFEMCVKEGDVSSVMCSYNRVDGVPACADPNLLRDKIRGEWDLHGYIVCDCDSVAVMVENHKFLGDTQEEAVARSLKAGLDLDCGVYYTNFTAGAVKQGKVAEEEIDTSLKYLYVVLMRLGFFDDRPKYKSLGKDDICSNANIELAARAAREGIVLLKNANQTLPLNSQNVKTLAVVGPHANATNAMLGNYAGIPCRFVAPIDGFSRYGKVEYSMGCGDIACKDQSFASSAMEAAKNADATIVLAGLDLSVEAESLDRTDLLLPGDQTQFINQVVEVAKGPVVLVMLSAGGVDISFAEENSKIGGILWSGYPGEEGGQAIADVVFGQYNPGGRLPLTWHKADYVDKLPMTSMPLRPNRSLGYPGRTYKFFKGSVVYPFGYGLSYTQFNYSLTSAKQSLNIKMANLEYCHDLNYRQGTKRPSCPAAPIEDLDCRNNDIDFEIEVRNTGTRDGNDVVLVYSKPPDGILRTHIKQVIGFKRVTVLAGGSQKVHFKINACKGLEIVDSGANRILPSGGHLIVIGDDIVSFPLQVSFS